MEKFKMLSGEELVAQGAKKASVSLPEIGLKDVFPNGSWLEQKQVQNALEARKHLIEVERIDKLGTLSVAHWREDLMLAEVTQRCGGHWQYLGHTVGKQWYIRPEETLLLMEMNCLQLKNNGVIVSIQQAYSLLLRDTDSLVQYKVYASLSRLGYKVFRHDKSLTYNTVNNESENTFKDSNGEQESNITDNNQKTDVQMESTDVENETDMDASTGNRESTITEENNTNNDKEIATVEEDNTNEHNLEVTSSVDLCDDSNEKMNVDIVSADICHEGSKDYIEKKLEVLCSREVKPCRSQVVHQSFKENLPDLYQKTIVTVKAPEEQHIPRNVFLNNTAYVLNLQNLRVKNVNPSPSSSSQTYSITDVNEQHVRRIRSSFSNESTQNNWAPQFFPNMRFSQQTSQFRQFNFWSHYNFNMAFQRPFFPGIPLRFQVFPRMQPMLRCYNSSSVSTPNLNITDSGRPQKRKREGTKRYHLDCIKKLAMKLQHLVQSGNTQVQNIQALQRLVNTYNARYKAKLQLSDALEINENETILETIELEDDDQSHPKKKRCSDESNTYEYNQNLESLKKIALKIKELEDKNESSPRHRRAFSNAIRTFNKSYDADIYVNSNYEVLDRRQIVITSSESEGTVEATPKPKKSKKKLRNPFNILKQLAEKQTASGKNHNSRKEISVEQVTSDTRSRKYSEFLTNTFNKDWLPNEDDFGRAEVICRNTMNNRLMDHSGDFLYEFMSGNLHNNWLDAKISYWQSCKESARKFEANSQNQKNFRLDSIITSEDCTDLKTVLKKLSIIKTNKVVKDECSLNIDFDVYNRDVQNFRKTNKPKPHFRIICIEESCKFPCGIDLATHRLNYNDDVTIMFAVVGTASISYLQVNPTDLPVYIPTLNIP